MLAVMRVYPADYPFMVHSESRVQTFVTFASKPTYGHGLTARYTCIGMQLYSSAQYLEGASITVGRYGSHRE